MNHKIIYTVIAGLTLGLILPLSAQAETPKYYKILSAQTALPVKGDVAPIEEKVLTFPVVVERTSTSSADINGKRRTVLLEETAAMPVVLERTTMEKPHHWPLSFGSWH